MFKYQFFVLAALLATLAIVIADEETPVDIDGNDDADSSKEGNYRLIVHLHRGLRMNLFGKKADGKLTVKVTVKGVTSTQDIEIKERLLANVPIKRTKIAIKGEVTEDSTVELSWKGEGEGTLKVTRVALIPTEGSALIDKARKAMCVSFRDTNILDLSGTTSAKKVSHRNCLLPISG